MNTLLAFHLLAKPKGAVCNLDCAYCFYLPKQELYGKSKFTMSDKLLEEYVKQLITSHQTNEVTFSFQGGEPTLMGVKFFQKAVKLVDKYKRSGMKVNYTIQTNGSLLDDDWGKFLKENNFLVGISIDGPEKLHNIYRKNRAGQGAFKQVMKGLKVLQKHEVDFNILCTVNAGNADHPVKVYRFFRDKLEAEFIQFIPIVERGYEKGRRMGGKVSDYSVKPEQYGDFLIAVFDEWVKADVAKVYVQMFDAALASWVGEPGGLCIFAPICGSALALEHNGDMYSCDHFVEPKYKLGNIQKTHMQKLVNSKQQRKFGKAKLTTLPKYCLECPVRFACHGGCPKNRFTKTPDGEKGLNYLCPGYKKFFEHVNAPMQMMTKLLQQNRSPAEIVDLWRNKN